MFHREENAPLVKIVKGRGVSARFANRNSRSDRNPHAFANFLRAFTRIAMDSEGHEKNS